MNSAQWRNSVGAATCHGAGTVLFLPCGFPPFPGAREDPQSKAWPRCLFWPMKCEYKSQGHVWLETLGCLPPSMLSSMAPPMEETVLIWRCDSEPSHGKELPWGAAQDPRTLCMSQKYTFIFKPLRFGGCLLLQPNLTYPISYLY